MTDPNLGLSAVRSLGQVLERTPNGADVLALAERLGLVTAGAHAGGLSRRAFKAQVSQLSPPQLSDEQSYWTSEFGRIVELIGVLQGQEKFLALKAKSARAKARSRVRARAAAAGDKLTAAQVNDQAEEDPAVADVDDQAVIVQLVLASALAAKEATAMYLQALSREITFRCSQMEARIYG